MRSASHATGCPTDKQAPSESRTIAIYPKTSIQNAYYAHDPGMLCAARTSREIRLCRKCRILRPESAHGIGGDPSFLDDCRGYDPQAGRQTDLSHLFLQRPDSRPADPCEGGR